LELSTLLLAVLPLWPPATTMTRTRAPAEFVEAYAAAHGFSGSVLIQKDGKVEYARSFGLANLPFKIPNTNATKYRIASITKAFTAVLVLQLHEQGKIDLGKPIRTYLPNYAGSGGDRVTVHQLLNHTSGLPNPDKGTTMETALRVGLPMYQRPWTSDQLLTEFCSGDLTAEPGKTFDYNNADYIVLGKIVERLHGSTYEQALTDRILRRLGMANTGMLRQGQIIDGLADTYFFRDDLKAVVGDLPVYYENWYAAGAMYSTAADVLMFGNALFGGQLLNKETLDLMIKPGLDDYGYGVWSHEARMNGRTVRIVKRPGRIMGAQSQLYRVLDRDVTVVILSNNVGTTDMDEFVAEIGKRVVAGRPGHSRRDVEARP
jgi:D-alanyl-D-alanine carboxypeptidase